MQKKKYGKVDPGQIVADYENGKEPAEIAQLRNICKGSVYLALRDTPKRERDSFCPAVGCRWRIGARVWVDKDTKEFSELRSEIRKPMTEEYLLCRCYCGKEKPVRKIYLKDGRSKYCASCAAKMRREKQKTLDTQQRTSYIGTQAGVNSPPQTTN